SPGSRRAAGPDVRMVPFLRRLSRRGARAYQQSGERRPAGWRIASSCRRSSSNAAGFGEPVPVSAAVWPGDIVQQALSAGLVEMAGKNVILSSGGAAYLRRALAAPDDAYSAQHQIRASRVLDDNTRVTVNECESPLGWLRNRKDRRTGKALISKTQFEAGERLRQDFLRAHMSASVTADWSGVLSSRRSRRNGAGGRSDLNDAAIAARTRFYRALETVGEDLSDVLVWVCCDGRGLRDIERTAGWPQRSGKLMLQTALRALARHYGLEPKRVMRPAGARPKIVQWGAEGYRPSLDTEAD
ncbi:MAG: DUF6456 domain-containing protein, partial [Hyphomicrobiaceae bacterium]